MNEEKDIFRNFKGIWIPKEIYLDERLSWTERILIGEIESLDNENGCFASNAYFSKFLKVSERTISESISKLKELNYISLDCFDGRKRKLKCNFKYRCDSDQNKSSTLETKKVEEKFYHNNTCINTNNNTNTSIDGVNNIPKVNSCKRKYTVKEFVIPTVDDIQKFIDEAIPERNLDALQIFNTYNDNDWYDSRGNKVSNWKTKIRNNWQKRKEDNESSMYPVYPMLCGEEQRKADEAYEREQEEKKKALAEAEIKAEKDFLETQNFINDLIK